MDRHFEILIILGFFLRCKKTWSIWLCLKGYSLAPLLSDVALSEHIFTHFLRYLSAKVRFLGPTLLWTCRINWWSKISNLPHSQLRSTGNQFCPPSPFSILTSRSARGVGDQLHDPVSQSGWSHKIATTTRWVVFDRAAKSASPLPLWHSPHGWLIPIPSSRLPSAMKAHLLQQMCEKIWLQTMKKHHVIPLYALENNPEASWISSPWWKSFELIRPQFQVQQWIT